MSGGTCTSETSQVHYDVDLLWNVDVYHYQPLDQDPHYPTPGPTLPYTRTHTTLHTRTHTTLHQDPHYPTPGPTLPYTRTHTTLHQDPHYPTHHGRTMLEEEEKKKEREWREGVWGCRTKQDVESPLVESSLVDHGDLIHVPYTSVVDQYPPPSPPCLTLDHTFEPVPTEGCC
ncbi:hypothetical protein Pcinc_034428 [Petrolisthes cinctipes]|uniref:Uncharacterized protein n=1 Tax=Petrolisthes cinctipes TaxID=88211 RepID=A0AAE1JXD0_PETCI|nr:hypothetical protein Pcinc_034428 [Petrolisthes cinctipes]